MFIYFVDGDWVHFVVRIGATTSVFSNASRVVYHGDYRRSIWTVFSLLVQMLWPDNIAAVSTYLEIFKKEYHKRYCQSGQRILPMTSPITSSMTPMTSCPGTEQVNNRRQRWLTYLSFESECCLCCLFLLVIYNYYIGNHRFNKQKWINILIFSWCHFFFLLSPSSVLPLSRSAFVDRFGQNWLYSSSRPICTQMW